MSKNRKQKQEMEMKIDPDLKKESLEQMDRAKLAASLGPALNFGPTVAAFTPQQRAAMQSANDMAMAFGLRGAEPQFGNPQEIGNTGMYGFSARPAFEAARAQLPEGYEARMQEFFDTLREQAKREEPDPKPTTRPPDAPKYSKNYRDFNHLFESLSETHKSGGSIWEQLRRGRRIY